MKQRVGKVIFAVVAIAVTVFAGINAASSGGGAAARSKLTLIAPAAPGGGWDGFARASQKAIKDVGASNNVQVVNIPGAGGTIGLSQFVTSMSGSEDKLLVTGAVMIGAIELEGRGDNQLEQTTPIARVSDDYVVLAVPASSDIKTLDDFVAKLKADPAGTSIAGGSLGSVEHLMIADVVRKSGVDPQQMNYIAYSGGGEVLSSMLSNTTVAAVTGYNDIADQVDAGNVRLLGISSPERLEGVDVPTFTEQGLDVVFANWRGFVAPGNISEETRAEYEAIITDMRNSEDWKESLKRNEWTDSFMVGAEFEQFLKSEYKRVAELVKEVGL
ncbi:Bug family tripartite tricarboxylate transporter substrate binding protein [Haematomicrobium sanguinis]|uniref:Bug family tripartite tricarboxylate transporter substrate binding protein n=1 Tax=Haematomicrobium sanguinis TaxID=479106 RepID=UPI00047B45F5|nr:tripartite tricarboxylate transporter substrate-binding protein [Haematomicrobium sanguinis]